MGICIGYERIDPAKDGSLPVGASRFGQFPDVPEGHPRVETGFILQINLRDILGMEPEGLLPKTGVLSIYRDAIEYYPDESVLRRPELSPEDQKRVLYGAPEDFLCKLVFGPDVEERAELFDEHPCYFFTDGMDYLEIDGEICKEVTASQYECEEMARGYTYESRITHEEKMDMVEKAKDWMCLFSIYTGGGLYGFFDCFDDTQYFWIRKSDLKNLRFDRLQFTWDRT